MSLELDVLRALLRLARRRTAPTLEAIVVRVGGEEPEVRAALRGLATKGLVQKTPTGFGLSLEGFAVAVAAAATKRPAATAASKPATKKKSTKREGRRAA